MAISTKKDRITVTFYSEIESDLVILEILNKSVPGRMRATKLKELCYNYLKEHEPELVESTLKKIRADKGDKEEDNINVNIDDNYKEHKSVKSTDDNTNTQPRKFKPQLQNIMVTAK